MDKFSRGLDFTKFAKKLAIRKTANNVPETVN